ncbi:MAG: hypothetical protein HY342_11440 [Candidatus Lambdaproteobacteria bacterium]|nr:hypothetical protein [Candidatus Lambdaproteobacteria bacterium]
MSPADTTRPQRLGVGLDTGGTFTDIVLWELAARRVLRKAKTPTTHGNYAVCIAAAFQALALRDPERAALRRVALATTLATNTVAENRVHPTALVVEPGDIAVPPTLHPHLVLLRSQVGFDAVEVVAVSERELLEKVGPLAAKVEGFAVSGYASTRNPAHELAIAEILGRAYGKPVVLGSQLTHRLNFMERARAAALNAGLLPVIVEWLGAVKGILAQQGIACPLYIVKGDGALMDEAEALRQPVQTLFSGPAASLHGGGVLCPGHDVTVIDVGGTTTDIGRIRGGRGQLRRGGLLINNRALAVDGLDMATFGLGGDSRLRLLGEGRYHFENKRALPFCRTGEAYAGFALDALAAELAGQWHFGDLELLDLVALDPQHVGLDPQREPDPGLRHILAAVQPGPRRVRALAAEFPGEPIAPLVEELLRRRLLVRIALTPTDVFCAAGLVPAFPQATARQAVALYARMLDVAPEALLATLRDTVCRQATATLANFLLAFDPPLDDRDPRMQRIVELLVAPESADTAALRLLPGPPLVLVGAGAPMLFADVDAALRAQVLVPEHGDVANAVGAIATPFVLRFEVTVEPLRYGGQVEVFDHEHKTTCPSLEAGMTLARARVREVLQARAEALGLRAPVLEESEELIEEYADFSRRTRKELVIARVKGVLTGTPE